MSSNEVEKAKEVASKGPSGPTIFSKIIDGTAQAKIIYRDDLCLAFHDICPQAPIHFLVIPLKPIPMLQSVEEADQEILGRLLFVANKVAQQEGLEKGYRVVINNGEDGCQTVFHLHIHVLGGRTLGWPPG